MSRRVAAGGAGDVLGGGAEGKGKGGLAVRTQLAALLQLSQRNSHHRPQAFCG